MLFEFKDSKRLLRLLPAAVCSVIAAQIVKFGGSAIPVVRLGCHEPSTSLAAADRPTEYLLQRWSQEWNSFVDVQDVDEVKDHDHLRVVPKPSCFPQVCC